MQRNLRLYTWYQTLFHLDFAWPVRFLYFLQFLSMSEVLLLEAVHQLTAVICEVPSGYFSDRFGRRRTLQLSAFAMCLSYSFFLNGSTLVMFVIGQVLHSAAFAFKSGSDVSIFFDSLETMNRGVEYEKRESRVVQIQLAGLAFAALVGGFIAMKGLWWAFFASAFVSFGLLVVTYLMKEPPVESREESVELQMFKQLGECAQYLKNPMLLWFFVYGVLAVLLDHIPYQFYQPYIEFLGIKTPGHKDATPIIAGVHMAIAMGLGAVAAGCAPGLSKRFGVGVTLLVSSSVHLVMIAVMALVLHPIAAILLMLRQIPNAIRQAPIASRVLPALAPGHRATYLSMQGLCDRLLLGFFMYGLSLFGSDRAVMSYPELQMYLWICLGFCGVVFLLLAYFLRTALTAHRNA